MANYKGFFKPRNPQKYKGDPTNIVYRSRWELLVMSRFDADPQIIWWSSEETVIPYRSPVDKRIHRYYVDFTVRLNTTDGKTKTLLIEVKPYKQTLPPVIQESKKKSKRYIQEVMTWGVNSAKWKAAREYCKDRGYEFKIMTEKELGIPEGY
jgi:hypothetical protein